MTLYLVLSFIALVVALGVLVLAGAESGDTGDTGGTGAVAGFVRDLRNGIAARRGRVPADDLDDEPAPVDLSIEALFREAAEDDDGYLHVDDITETFARARERAVKSLHGISHH
jgi:hypothetical protein